MSRRTVRGNRCRDWCGANHMRAFWRGPEDRSGAGFGRRGQLDHGFRLEWRRGRRRRRWQADLRKGRLHNVHRREVQFKRQRRDIQLGFGRPRRRWWRRRLWGRRWLVRLLAWRLWRRRRKAGQPHRFDFPDLDDDFRLGILHAWNQKHHEEQQNRDERNEDPSGGLHRASVEINT